MVTKCESICHVCLVEEDSNTLFDNNAVNYLELIKEYIGINLVQYENFPSLICSKCSSELMIVVEFVSKCRASSEKLGKMYLQDVPLKDIKEEDDDVALSTLCHIKLENSQDDFHDYEDATDIYPEIKSKEKNYKREKTKTREKKLKKEKRKLKLECICETCGLKTQSKSALIVHNRSHTGERPYGCELCSKAFSQPNTLKEHIGRVHSKGKQWTNKSFVCDFCGKIFCRKNELSIHLRVHTKEKPYQCTICQERFTQKGGLNTHLRRHNGEKPFLCKSCGLAFTSSSALNSHMLVHTSEKKFNCHICNKLFKSKHSLRIHILIHSDTRAYVCDLCGKRFAQKVNLKYHIKSRHSERSGHCDICKRFYADLVTHDRTHSGDKPFQCSDCGKGFSMRSHYTLHLRRHRESSKFQCTFDRCKAAFAMQGQLDFHIMKIHTKEYAFVCSGTGCNKGFYRLTDLNRHKNLNPSCKISSSDKLDIRDITKE